MARLILHEENGPYQIPPQPSSVWICGCGLSQNLPHCDGSHKITREEEDGILYEYDKERKDIINKYS